MNVIKVKFNIDIDNEQQLKSFNAFVASLKSNGGVSPIIEAPVKDIKAKEVVQQSATQQTTSTAAQASTPEPGAKEGEHTTVKKLDAIRKLIGLKAGEHREAMKLKLNEYGVSTATDLPVDKYQEFHDYLEKLA